MESILRSFGLPAEDFSAFLRTCGGVVAGSAALAAYLDDAALPWAPNDLDVWLRVPDLAVEQVAQTPLETRLHRRADALATMAHMAFARMGFAEPTTSYERDGSTAEFEAFHRRRQAYLDLRHDNDFILDILYFEKEVDQAMRKVQVIVMADLPVDALLQRFDLSVCRVAWDGARFALASGTKHDIRCRRTLCHWPASASGSAPTPTQRQRERVDKYKARGFAAYAPL